MTYTLGYLPLLVGSSGLCACELLVPVSREFILSSFSFLLVPNNAGSFATMGNSSSSPLMVPSLLILLIPLHFYQGPVICRSPLFVWVLMFPGIHSLFFPLAPLLPTIRSLWFFSIPDGCVPQSAVHTVFARGLWASQLHALTCQLAWTVMGSDLSGVLLALLPTMLAKNECKDHQLGPIVMMGWQVGAVPTPFVLYMC